MRSSEQLQCLRAYAMQLASLLDQLLTDEPALEAGGAEQVAVLMPGHDEAFIDELREATAERAVTEATKLALAQIDFNMAKITL